MNIMTLLKKGMALFLSFSIIFAALPVPQNLMQMLARKDLSFQTGTSAAVYTRLKDFQTSVSDYSFFEEYGFSIYEDEPNDGTYVIPGLKICPSFDLYNQPATCGNMVVQGLCVAKEYLIVSCYCHDSLHNSVLFMIHKQTGKLFNTIVLPDLPHAGSVAYDPGSQLVWICTGKTNKASISALRLEDMIRYSYQEIGSPITYFKRYAVPMMVRNSFMTYYNDKLIAGTFMYGFTGSALTQIYLDESGLPKRTLGKLETKSTSTIASSCQGIAMNHRYIFASFSNGPYQTSKLCIFSYGDSQLFEINALASFELPECLEQLWLDGDDLYLMFESACWPFRNDTIHHIDRIIKINVPVLLESVK
jgi:hypothetical protein